MPDNKPANNIWRSRIFWQVLGIFTLLVLFAIVFTAYISMSGYLKILSNIDNQDIFLANNLLKEQQKIITEVIIILVLLLLVIVIASAFIARRITFSILEILASIKKIKKGHLEIKLAVREKNELGELAESISELTTKLKEGREREQFVSKLKSGFVSIVAHQLRTPITAIKWVLYTLKDGDFGQLNNKQLDYVDKGAKSTERMVNLISDLLNVSHMERGKFDYKFSKNDFRQFFLDIANSFQGQCKKNSLQLKIKIAERPVFFKFDPDRLSMAVSNLINNAIKYNNPGGKITITAEKQDDYMKITIADTGVGIPQDEQKQIFSTFFRASNALKLETEGTGLGLFITKEIIDNHGGKIWFKSEEGKGSTFYITLPLYAKDVPRAKKSFENLITNM